MVATIGTPRKLAEIRDWPLVSWWIRVTSPPPGSLASQRNPQWREEVVSLLIPIIILLAFVGIFTSLHDPIRLAILGVAICCNAGALFLKRAGMAGLTGVVIVITVELSLFSFVLTAGGGRPDIQDMPLLDHLLQAVIVAMAFFTPITGVGISLANCIFMFIVLNYYPHGEDLPHHLAEDYWGIILPPIILHIFVTLIFFVIMRSLMKAIGHAYKAEEVARLAADLAQQNEAEAIQRKQEMEKNIHDMLDALTSPTAGADFSPRVPISREDILWRVGYSINTLLARMQGLKQEKTELEKARTVANQLRECMRQGQYFPLNQWTGTLIDPLIMEFNKSLSTAGRKYDPISTVGFDGQRQYYPISIDGFDGQKAEEVE
jgi:hypothetical protein